MRKYLHSGMVGAPQWTAQANAGRANAILTSALVTGFNVKTPSSATCASGVITLNFPADPGFELLAVLRLSGASIPAANADWKVLSAENNQVLLTAPGVPDGPIGGALSVRYAPLGWLEPFAASANNSVFKQSGGGGRCVRVNHGANGYPMFRGYADMSDLDTGTEPFPTPAQYGGDGVYGAGYTPTANSSWEIWGNETFFVFASLSANGSYGEFTAFFGDLVDVPTNPVADFSTCLLVPGSNIWRGYILRGADGASSPQQVVITGETVAQNQYPVGVSWLVAAPGRAVVDDSGPKQFTWRGFLPAHAMLSSIVASGYGMLSNVPGVNGRMVAPRSPGFPYSGDLGAFYLDDEA